MRNPNRHGSWIIILILSLWSFSLAQNPPEIRELEQGKPIERELAGGQIHAYSISLTAGQFLHAIVEQRGVDVVVVLFDPEGKQVAEVDSPNGTRGPEPVLLVAKAAGDYRLEVRSLEKKAAAGHYEMSVEGLRVIGRYEVRVEALRAATPREKLEYRAREFAAVLAATKTDEERAALLAKEKELVTVPFMRALYEHGRVFRSQKNYPQALAISRLALPLAEQIGDKSGVGDFLYNIGFIFYWQGDSAQALEYLQKSFTLREQLGEKMKAGDSLNVIGSVYSNQQNNPTKALEYYRKSLALYQETGDRQGEIGTLNNIGFAHQSLGNFGSALEYRQKALSLAEALGNKGLVAQILSNLAMFHFQQGNFAPALEYNKKSLSLYQELGNKAQVAAALNRMSLVYRLQGDFSQALESSLGSLKLAEPLQDKALLADIVMTLGLVYGSRGDVAQSLESYQKSLTFAEGARAKPLIANALEKIGGAYHSQGDMARAIEYYQSSLKLSEELGNKRQIIFTISAMGAIHRSQGNYAQALQYYRKSLKLSEEIGNKVQIATAMSAVGIIHFDQGDYTKALEYFQQSLKLREEIGQAPGIQGSLNNIGEVYRLQGDFAQAMEYYQKSLTLAEKMGSKGGIRTALTNIGETYRLQGNYAQAMEHLRKSLTLSEEMGARISIPETLNSMAAVRFSQADYRQALEFAERAADVARQTGHREYLRSALTMSGRAYRALNQPDKARQSFEEAIAIGESLRSTVAGQESRASYFATVQQPYELYIDLLMHMHKQHPVNGHDALALQVTERARARSLLEALSEARADIRQGVEPSLLQRERTLQQRLNVAAERQMRLLTGKHTEEQVAAVKKEIDALTAEFQDVQAQIRQRSPRYAALTQPAPLGLKEIQALLDSDTLLLEYALGEERSYLWAVTPTSIKSFELPKRSEIDKEVRRAVSLLSDGKQWTTSDKVESEYAEVAGRLSSILLDPVAAQLKGKRLVIVADGALQYLPFGALPSPKSKVQGPKSRKGKQVTDYGQPLIVEHEIVSLPSASTLA
nr:tetratricopeptide repeat protein [Pyrinomonadaceae bacterium]